MNPDAGSAAAEAAAAISGPGIAIWALVGLILLGLSILLWVPGTQRGLEQRVRVLRLNFVSLTLGTAFFSLGLAMIVYSVLRYAQWFPGDNVLLITFSLGSFFGVFSFASFYIARRIEKAIRLRIDSFAEFVEWSCKVFAEPCKDYRMMVIYPYFGLLNTVREKMSPGLNERVRRFVGQGRLRMLVGNTGTVGSFLDVIRDHADKDADALKEVNGQDKIGLYKELGGDSVLRCSFKNPIHLITAEKRAAWGSVGSPGECTGFYSTDRDIVNSFKSLFDLFFDQEKERAASERARPSKFE